MTYGLRNELADSERLPQNGLLQASLVYIQTLLLQHLLADPAWMNKMTKEDLRALTPLIYANVNPYGTIHLDLTERLEIERAG